MRGALVSLAFALAVLIVAPAHTVSAAPSSGTTVIALQQEQAPDQKIDITVQRPGGVAWYRNPVWIAIGILAIIVVLLLIVMVAKGNDTTVIRQ